MLALTGCGPGVIEYGAGLDAQSEAAVRRDRQSPTISLTAPTTGEVAQDRLLVVGTATDNVSVVRVEVGVDDANFVTAPGTTSFTLGLGLTALAPGTHAVTARAYDAAGNVGAARVTFVVTSTAAGGGSGGGSSGGGSGGGGSGGGSGGGAGAPDSGSSGAGFGTALPLPLAASTGATFYVDSVNGLDSNTGLLSAPWRTLDKAASMLQPGQTVLLRAGTYGAGDQSQLTWSRGGTAAAPITIAGFPNETVILARLVHLTGSYVRVRGLVIERNSYPTDVRFGQGGSSPGGNVGLWFDADHLTIESCEVRNATMTGLFGGGDDVQILGNSIHDNGTTHDDHGIYWARGGAGGLIANNVVEHNYDFGIQIQYASTGIVVANNTIVANGRTGSGGSGVVLGGTASNIRVVNNISAWNVEMGYRTCCSPTWVPNQDLLTNNLGFGNPGGTIGPSGYGDFSVITGTITADPLVIDRASRNYRLGNNSPAIGAADPAYVPARDRDGRIRATPDLGAYAH